MGSEQPQLSAAALTWLQGLLRERLGLDVMLRPTHADTLSMTLKGSAGVLEFESAFSCFDVRDSALACAWWSAGNEGFSLRDGVSSLPLPGKAVCPTPLVSVIDGGLRVHYDLMGLIYWALCRIEEVGCATLDRHARFPGAQSHAVTHDYVERPIVDEWLGVLRQWVVRVWPRAAMCVPEFRMHVSHDIDAASAYAFLSELAFARRVGGDLLKRRDPRAALQGFRSRFLRRSVLDERDPYNTFDWLMSVSDDCGLKSAFYFICGRTDARTDARYDIESPRMRSVLRRIHERGHEIGLHPSYHTYLRPDVIAAEANHLRETCAREGIEQEVWGGRMHFLRWAHPLTMQGWERAQMSYDSTLGYADRAGFRCGTCFEYPAFDPVADAALALRIRPLIAMECTVMDPRYMGLGHGEEAFETFCRLMDACRAVGGQFTLLWHNSRLVDPDERALYRRLCTLGR